MMSYFLFTWNFSVVGDLTAMEMATCFITAAIHDFAHPGLNNNFLINSGHELAITYNDRSVLENMHVAEAFRRFEDDSMNFWDMMSKEEFKNFR